MHPALEAAQRLAPTIEAAGDEIERGRQLTPAVVDALVRERMFRLLLPKTLGGWELDLPTYVRVLEAIGRADASTGWCLSQCGGLCFLAAHLCDEGRVDVWGDPRAVVANGQGPDNRAVRVPGGYRVTGRWGFSSGCHHATWLSGIAPVIEDGEPRRRADGSIELRSMLFPVEQAEILDVWHVGGLRGTGSDAFAVTDLFVPEHHSVSVADDPVREPNPLYRFSQTLVFANGFGMVALGLAQATVDCLVELAGGKRPRGWTNLMRDHAVVQMQLGQAAAHVRAGRALLRETVEEVWDAVCRRGEPTLDERVRMRLAGTHALREAERAVDVVYTAAGATAIYQSHPLQRRFQDMHTITQHVQARLGHYESVGRHLLGLEPDPLWL
ncbi:MAG TPA: acyl-CoA dehydrogenase family protein [Chloroflexota bacterium]|nr:acyl-CoA dehydrogenase family protein [Chloroflexota bacterium]